MFVRNAKTQEERKLLGSLGSADLPVVIENSDEAALILYWKR